MKCWYYTREKKKEKMSAEVKRYAEKKIKEFMGLSLLTTPGQALEIMKKENESEEEKPND